VDVAASSRAAAGLEIERLAEAAGLPMDAVRFLAGGLARWGFVVTDRASVRPTLAGVTACRLWTTLPARVEAAWRDRLGDAVVHELGGTDVHGVLTAELGAVTAAFDGSLALQLNLLRVLGDEPTRPRDLPARTGIARESVDLLLREADDLGLVEPGTLRLTTAGALVRSEGWSQLRAAEQARPDLTEPLVAAVAGSAPGLEPMPGSWRTVAPYKSRTEAFRRDPARALPHHPMPVRQGGWPDGA
jgi:hypothetical protein